MKRTLIIFGVVLIVAGALALAYGGFTYTADTHSADLGVAEVEVEDKERVEVPLWAGIGAVAVGAGVLAAGARRRA